MDKKSLFYGNYAKRLMYNPTFPKKNFIVFSVGSLSSSLGELQNSKSQEKPVGSQEFESIDAAENNPEIANIKDIEIPMNPFLK